MASGLKRGCRFIVITFFLLLALAAGAAFWLWQGHRGFADTAIGGVSADATLEVASGDAFPTVLRKLREQGVSHGSDLQWRLLARETNTASQLKVGEYALAPELTPRELLQRMREGRTLQYRFTLVEGWNIRQVRVALRNATPLQQKTAQMSDAELMAALGHPGQHPEGRFLPETYVYTRSESDLDVLKRAHAAMEKAMTAAWEDRAAGIPLQSAEEALILASIIEKETGIAEERPAIAGVFARRLKIGMPLQTDPTVIYGIGSSYDGNIRRRDLTTDTPYNTYTRKGLTPTPIAMPGVDALKAAVNPADGDALYFVAVGDGSGRHLFSATLAEHNAAVAKYLVTRRQTLDKAARQ
ncbi:endolytic transglycosylase MltG [Pseudoxanthomonas sp. SL93]|uniref:endolytic transglycosylase MltG n=1 Tax=Pseudoxanthomonas sp. SL93 TaxID=2995142 RepID=UPI00226F0D51|nr:endolytic transglycosylase MltG [Pseudoxanthomonas sp. SL93]WAC64467.1 endolytic transglycosylase MltG [Pseudoxanthomonas sp. SL93]